MPPLISLCMIAKDEEDEIALALDSAAQLVDELVVYDTGSSDDTVEIARAHGARVVAGYWDDDFARARNAALEHCSGTWILWLDADESVHGDFGGFRRTLAALPAQVEALTTQIELLEGGGLVGRSSFPALRIFRRERCRWDGRLHEQVVRRDGSGSPACVGAAELRLLHRGYIAAAFSDGSKYERNLRLARQALDDPGTDRAFGLFTLGRTLLLGPEPERALEPLEEAVALPAGAIGQERVRRYTLQTLTMLYLQLGRHEDALGSIEELRRVSTHQVTADVLEARVRLAQQSFDEVLELTERVPFLDVDDDGNEIGRHQVAALRSRALAALGRPGEAADVLLDPLASHGVLDEPLELLAAYLLAAGRGLTELVDTVRPDVVAVFAGAVPSLPPAQADVVLTALHERYPDRLEPLAIGAGVAERLPVARALWWSAELRRRGLVERCPLVAIAANRALESLVRLRAAAAALAAFADQRAVEPAREVVLGLGEAERAEALADVATISPRLTELLATASSTVAVLLSLDGERRDGFLACTTRRDSRGATVVKPDQLPLRSGGAHLLVVRDVLASLPPAEVGFALDEWSRVLAPGGELVIELPDVALAARRLLEVLERAPGGTACDRGAAEAEALRALYGRRRFGEDGEDEAHRSGWTQSSLAALVAGHGFAVEETESNPARATLRLRARASAVATRMAAGPRPEVSVVVVSEHGAAMLQRCLRALASSEAGTSYEVVCLDNGAGGEVGAFLTSLAGAATVLFPPLRLHPGAAANLAVRFATGRVVVLLRDTVEVTDGWAAALAGALTDGSVAAVSAVLADETGTRVGGAVELRGESAAPRLVVKAVAAERANALGAGCVALARETWRRLRGLSGGLDLGDAVIDLSLRARALGEVRAVEALRLTERSASVRAPHGTTASASELAHRWAGRIELEPPEVVRRTSAASLLPSMTLLDRIDRGAELHIGQPRPGGCNLVGDFAATGLEGGRVLAWQRAQEAADLACSRLAFSAGHLDTTLAGGEPFAFDTTLLCLDSEDLVEYVARVGLESLRGRYTILDWHWPFATPGQTTAAEASMVTEIWTPSAFSQRALRQATDRPVRLQPLPVLPAVARLTRLDLGIPEGFLFAALADVGRGRPGEVALANPVGTVEAFCTAFSEGSGAALFLALCGTRTQRTAEACREAAGGRNDVVVAERLPTAGAESLLALADCFVSLHRSSAFGIAIARALASGVPVVAAGVGGPLEYLDHSCAELVEVTAATTSAAHVPYPAGLAWGEPDLEDAAAALQLVHEDPATARAKAKLAAARIARTHGVELAGRMLRRRIEAVSPLRPEPSRAHRGRRRARR
jgi:hypothetical protein